MLPGQQLDQVSEIQKPADGSGDCSESCMSEVLRELDNPIAQSIGGERSAFAKSSDIVNEDGKQFLDIPPLAVLAADQNSELSEAERNRIDDNFFGNRANGNPGELVVSLDSYTRLKTSQAA